MSLNIEQSNQKPTGAFIYVFKSTYLLSKNTFAVLLGMMYCQKTFLTASEVFA
jgi:hypothetical protein